MYPASTPPPGPSRPFTSICSLALYSSLCLCSQPLARAKMLCPISPNDLQSAGSPRVVWRFLGYSTTNSALGSCLLASNGPTMYH